MCYRHFFSLTAGLLTIFSFIENAIAHHSFAAEFSYELFGAREGRVVEVLFVNPHAHIFFAVEDEHGSEVIWDAQSSTPQNLLRRGWGPSTIKVGENVVIEGNLGLNGTARLWITSISKENGEIIFVSDGDN